jgi:DNA-binding beta-propeller fold protein YncE
LLFGLSACFDEGGTSVGPGEDEGQAEPKFSLSQGLDLRTPGRIALTKGERLLVSDYFQGLVFGVDPVTRLPEGGFVVEGRPMAVAQLKNRILVGNASKKTIEVYGADGRRRGYFSGGPGSVGLPTDIAVDLDARLVVAVDGAQKVLLIFDDRGVLHRTVTGFNDPVGVGLDPLKGEILVSDYGILSGTHSRVLIFDYEGNSLGEISGEGSCNWFGGCSGGFSTPQGVAVDDQGRIFIVDALQGQVLVFNRYSGDLIGHLGEFGTTYGHLSVPLDLVISLSGQIFVTSSQTGAVEVFGEGDIVQ